MCFAWLCLSAIVVVAYMNGSIGGIDGGGGNGAAPQTGALLSRLPVSDLKGKGGGAWKLDGRVDWRQSSVTPFQGSNALKVTFRKGSGAGSGQGNGGIALSAAPRGLPSNGAIMVCDVFFAPGWDWSRGGKLGPGLFVGTGSASGGNHSPTGASCRLSFKDGGAAIAYIYVSTGLPQEDSRLKSSGYGAGLLSDVFKPGSLKVGKWNHVEVGIKMNTFDSKGAPNPDGMALVHVNGTTGVVKNIRWSRSPDLNIRRMSMHPFFGGPSPSVVDCTAYYKNFALYAWK
jgi:hypothetical protein